MNRRHADAEQAAADQELSCLSPKQREVLVLACKGLDCHETGSHLGISFATVQTHRQDIRAKLEMSIIEAAVLATRARWV